jgi:transposase
METTPSPALARPAALTPEVQKAIVEALCDGNYLKVACSAAGITYAGFAWWRKRYEDGDPDAQVFADFFDAVKRAIAVSETRAVRDVRAGVMNWQSRAWLLERRFPSRWGKKDRTPKVNVNVSTLTDEQLRDLTQGKGGG